MQGYGSFVYGVMTDCIALVKRPVKGRWVLCCAYVLMVVKFLVGVKVFGMRLRQERFLGYTVSFNEYETFLYVFSEVFMRREYAFDAGRNNPFVIDCGANIGLATLFFKWEYPQSRVVAFEPNRQAFAFLEENVRRNKLDNVVLHNVGLSDKEGIVKLFGGAGALTASLVRERGGSQEQQIRVVPLSQYITQPVDLLKMDIEGAEGRVLEEVEKKRKVKFIRRMIMEYHHNIAGRSQWSDMARFLERNGFAYNMRAAWNSARVGSMQDLMVYAERR